MGGPGGGCDADAMRWNGMGSEADRGVDVDGLPWLEHISKPIHGRRDAFTCAHTHTHVSEIFAEKHELHTPRGKDMRNVVAVVFGWWCGVRLEKKAGGLWVVDSVFFVADTIRTLDALHVK